jgi:hypothetical protein
MKIVHNIDLGFPQQTFDFDQSHALDLKKVLTFIDRWIAENDHAMLDQVISHLTIQQDKWSTTYVLDSVNTLFKDEKIHFLINGKKFLPENVKINFSNLEKSKSQFVQKREIFSVIRTHLSDPDRWKYVEIIKPERVRESDLLQAQMLGEKLFGTVDGKSQNSLCRYLRKHLREWNDNLEMFRVVSEKGQYPGTNEIQEGLALTRKLLDIHDPCEFIETFINDEDRLRDATCHFTILENFYKNQIHTWDILLKAVEDFTQNREDLEKNIDAKKALDTLYTILTNPNPYSIIEEIPVLISTVKPVNDLIIEKKIAFEKALAFEKIEKIIDKIVNALDEKNAHSDMRNKALYPLQSIKRKINTASSIQDIADYLEEATAEFDYAMDRLI